jgi:ribose transport system ATP-binding protein
VLLLDESTAFLSTFEIDALFRVINTLREQNIAVGYISHHLDEIERIADDITILKDGGYVGSYAHGELTEEQIKAKMVGREIGQDMYGDGTRSGSPGSEVVLKLDGIRVRNQIEPITLELHAGEVLGIGGLKGAGGEVLLSIINGDLHAFSGNMMMGSRPYHPVNPSHAWAHGIAYLPGDRTSEGLILDFSVMNNLSLANIPQRAGFIDRAKENAMVERLIRMLQIKAANARVTCGSLSGGNLQKVVLGKCVGAEPRVLLLNNPTRGIDVGARTQIYQIIRDLAAQGMSVILLSEDLPELIGMSDRIVVLRKGRVSHVFERGTQPSEQDVVEHMI